MSLLLDALKKSEAQRRRGTSPTIDLSGTPPSGNSRRSGWRRWLILATGVLLVAAAPWLWPYVSERMDRSGNAAGKSGSSPASANAAAADEVPLAAVRTEAALAPVAGGASARRVAEAGPAQETVPRSDTSGNAQAGRSRQADSENQPVSASAEPDALEGPSTQAAESGDARRSMQELRRMAQEQAQEEVPPQAESRQQPEPGEAGPPKAAGNFIRPWEMPQARRAEFPPLELTVHFYAERPGDRFVLINGERYGEGQRVETGVRLAEIMQRGAVVEFAGYRILIE